MSTDDQTLKVYGQSAQDYADLAANYAEDPVLTTFIQALPRSAHVLDLGCGPGFAAARMATAGHLVDATDAVPEMVEMAGKNPGVTARLATFDDIKEVDAYDGIWANFSLLHAPRADMPRHLSTLRRALKPGGLFHIGMKTGTGEKRDAIGRLYTYYTESELNDLLRAADLTPFSSRTGQDTGLDGTVAKWVTIAAHG